MQLLRSAVCTTNLGFGCQHAVTSQIVISYKAGACQQTAFADHRIRLMHKVPLNAQGCPAFGLAAQVAATDHYALTARAEA